MSRRDALDILQHIDDLWNIEALSHVLPAELLEEAGVNAADSSRKVTRLLTLELYLRN
jgi:hypothetical protein